MKCSMAIQRVLFLSFFISLFCTPAQGDIQLNLSGGEDDSNPLEDLACSIFNCADESSSTLEDLLNDILNFDFNFDLDLTGNGGGRRERKLRGEQQQQQN
ncbi:expressed unknown protein [Seminavis robusta]|uniref:Uncharacterized protein n=1 Tax=Seminavis robusta TaxID=568900 RepID=A0A9N8HST3_9STRA|nr:expressed unknown protein [Seminavis robusta]|eukprot:Sro1425_g271570.1 n/a (100) ;mRNA; f:16215-16514